MKHSKRFSHLKVGYIHSDYSTASLSGQQLFKGRKIGYKEWHGTEEKKPMNERIHGKKVKHKVLNQAVRLQPEWSRFDWIVNSHSGR